MTDSATITTTVRATPPKYQVTIPQEVREGLEFDGDAALIEIDVSLIKMLDEKGGES